MKPLLVLLSVFVLSLLGTRIFREVPDVPRSGRMAMAAMLLFTSIGHFVFSKGIAMMLPDLVPYKIEVVFLPEL